MAATMPPFSSPRDVPSGPREEADQVHERATSRSPRSILLRVGRGCSVGGRQMQRVIAGAIVIAVLLQPAAGAAQASQGGGPVLVAERALGSPGADEKKPAGPFGTSEAGPGPAMEAPAPVESSGRATEPVLPTVESFGLVPPAEDTRRALEEAVAAGRLPRSLADAALGGGSVRVIVELRLSAAYRSEGQLGTARAIQDQRTAIRGAQDAVVSQLRGMRAANAAQPETVPYLALDVDAAALAALARSPEVVRIGEDTPRQLRPEPDGTESDHADRNPSLAQSVPLVGVEEVWAAGFTGAGRAVAVLDSGVDKTHPFLAGKVVSEACFSTTSAAAGTTSLCPGGVDSVAPGSGVNCSPQIDGCGHGTHVAGIAAGRGAGFSGVAKDAGVIAVQVFSRIPNTGGTRCSPQFASCITSFSSDMALGLEQVLALRGTFAIGAVNMSIGGGQFFSQAACDADVSNAAVKAAIDNLRAVDVATVIASGNEGFTNSLAAPGCISTGVSVGNSTKADAVYFDPVTGRGSNSASFLNLLAPGRLINSSVPGPNFQAFTGTSMAAPHVAGAWTLLKQKTPNATVSQVLNALTATGRPITDPRNGITRPRIQVDAAANALGGAPAIPNDAFANAAPIAAVPFVATINTTGATTETNEPTRPTCGGTTTPLGKTVWYRFAAQVPTTLRISTEGSSFDTVLFAWRNASIANPGSFNSGRCNDDVAQGDVASRLELTAQPGEVWMIQVGGYNGQNGPASGTLRLSASGPAVSCSPRPPVQVSTARTGTGSIQATITAGAGVINSLQLGVNRPLQNAVIDVAGGPTRLTVPHTYNPNTASVTMVVSRQGAGPATVPIVVSDACGDWPTLVGMGTNV